MSQRNSLVVGGVDVLARYGLVFTDDYDLGFPEVKTSYVDLAGGDGSVDLTETSGAVRYKDRTQTLTLLVPRCTQREAEAIRTSLAALLHGRKYTYQLGVDPGYDYRGRFAIGQLTRIEHTAETIPVTVTADPYKSAGVTTMRFNARGGVRVPIDNGTRSVCPTIEVNHAAVVGYHGESWALSPGAHRITDLWLDSGESEMIIDTDPTAGEVIWSDIGSKTWSDVADLTWAELAIGGAGINDSDTLSTYADLTWADIADKRWLELSHPATESDAYAAYIQYERQYL